jgi:hypothetical protein
MATENKLNELGGFLFGGSLLFHARFLHAEQSGGDLFEIIRLLLQDGANDLELVG